MAGRSVREAAERLFAEKPWPLYFLRQKRAVKDLAASPDPSAVDPLVKALVEKHRLSDRIRGVLRATEDPARIDRLWRIWKDRRHGALENILEEQRWLPDDDVVRPIALLKLGVQDEFGFAPADLKTLEPFFTDRDEDVRASCDAWLARLAGKDAALHLTLLLRLKRFAAIGNDRAVLDRVLALRRGRADLAADADAYVKQLPHLLQLVVALDAGGADIGSERKQAFELVPFFADPAKTVRAGAEAYLSRLDEEAPVVGVALRLKLGRQATLGTDPRTVRTACELFTDDDGEVSAGVRVFFRRLPSEPVANDELYDLWIRTESAELVALFDEQERLPTSVAKRALFLLVENRIGEYHELGDETGQLLREAHSLATPKLKDRIRAVVVSSRDLALISAFGTIMGAGMESARAGTIEARIEAGDEDGVVDSIEAFRVMELLEHCERWHETGRRPNDPDRRKAVEAAVAAWRRLGRKVEFTGGGDLPEGLTDFFTWWEEKRLPEAELVAALSSPDPFARAGSAFALSRKDRLPSGHVDKMAKSVDWPERFVARLIDPVIAAPSEEHVRWTSLLHDIVADVVLRSTAKGTPRDSEELREVVRRLAGRRDPTSVLQRELANVLLAFQTFLQEGIGTDSDAGTAEEKDAAADGGEAAGEDLDALFGKE